MKGTSRQSIMRARRKARGVCIECGKEPTESKCLKCRLRAKETRIALHNRRKALWADMVGAG